MNYRDWQRQHRDWPLRMKDLVTNKRRVKLVCDKLTVSNKMHRAGDIYTVVGVYRGRLSLGGHADGLAFIPLKDVVLADELLLFQRPLSPLKTRLLEEVPTCSSKTGN